MVVNEKGLIRAMKEAYKGVGYNVMKIEHGGKDWLLLDGHRWAVEFELKNFPRQALGLIVEHIGTLPEFGEAYCAKKGESQTEILEMADSRVNALNEAAEEYQILDVRRTPLEYSGLRVYQMPDRGVLLIDPEREAIIAKHEFSMVDRNLLVEGLASRVYIQAEPLHAGDEANLKQLEQYKWA